MLSVSVFLASVVLVISTQSVSVATAFTVTALSVVVSSGCNSILGVSNTPVEMVFSAILNILQDIKRCEMYQSYDVEPANRHKTLAFKEDKLLRE